MKRPSSPSFQTPPARQTRSSYQQQRKISFKNFIQNPPQINPTNQERLLAEATKIANDFLRCGRFQDLLCDCKVDHATCFGQAQKVIVSFREPVCSNDNDDTRHSWAWCMSNHGLDNVDIYINANLKRQIERLQIATESLDWKKYAFMIGILIFHEFAHLSLRWQNLDSVDVGVNEMGVRAERAVFGTTMKYVFNHTPANKTSQDKWIIDDTIKLIDFKLDDPVTPEYIENVYAYSIKEEYLDDFHLTMVKQDPKRTLSPGCWKTRLADEQADPLPRARRVIVGIPLGQCVKARARGLPQNPDDEEDDD